MSTQLSYRKSVSILLMAVLTFQVACRGWIEKPIVPDTGTAIPHRGILRITKTDGAVITLKDAIIVNDSIVHGGVAVALADIDVAAFARWSAFG